MSSLTTLARPYAKAAFGLASESADGSSALHQWQHMLRLASQIAANPDVHALLDNPLISTAQVVELFTSTAGEQFNDRFNRFVGVLADNNRLSLLPEITALFEHLKQEAEQKLEVRVVSAVALSDEQASRMSAALARRFECEIELQQEIDESVLGGAVIYTGDQVIDGSLRGRVEKLASTLSR